MLEKTAPEQAFGEALERYLAVALHAHIRVMKYAGARNFPSFISLAYMLYEARIAGRRCVFLAGLKQATTPSDIAKHVNLVRNGVDAIVVFATPSLSPHNRSRLISHGVPFVVPGNQLYIPDLAMDLREHFRAPKERHADGLTPAAQAVLFDHLLRHDPNATTPSLIAAQLNYSPMSIGRAFDDLVEAGIARTENRGKERHIAFRGHGRALFDASCNLLRGPVRAVKFTHGDPSRALLKRAGESALAELSDLSRPSTDTFAIAAGNWRAAAQAASFVETSPDRADFIVETWFYDPAALSDTDTVDPLSLYTQFRDHRDERVAMAAEHLLENIPW